jgi:alpha-amylase
MSQTTLVSQFPSLSHSAKIPQLDVLDAVLDYPTWFPLVAGFQTQFGNLSDLSRVITASQGAYKNGLFGTGSFLENHDQPRFPSLSNDTAVWVNSPC